MKHLITPKELKSKLQSPSLILLDVSQKPDVLLKNARYFNLGKDFSDSESEFPNTLPSPSQFEKNCQKLGINIDSEIVVYDNHGIFNSPRVWWMFQIMGHQNILILNATLEDCIDDGFETEKLIPKEYPLGNFIAKYSSNRVRNYDFIKDNLISEKALVIDARSEGRFNGTAPEPREALQSGNIPNSFNLPYTKLLENGKFKSKNELEEIFKPFQYEKRPLVFSCGSGVTACILLLGSEGILNNSKSIYDGSWTEWATKEKLMGN